MNNDTLRTLVNFRASKQLLESFDRVCFLSGKTRTQVLSEMMKQRVLTVGSKLASNAARQTEIESRIKTAVESRLTDEGVQQPRQWSKELYRRLKPFSSFDREDD